MVRLNTERTVVWHVETDFDELQQLHETYAELHTNFNLDENYELYTYAQSVLQKMQSANEEVGEDEKGVAKLSTAEYHILRTMVAWYLDEFEGEDEERDNFLNEFIERLKTAESTVSTRE